MDWNKDRVHLYLVLMKQHILEIGKMEKKKVKAKFHIKMGHNTKYKIN